LALSTDESGGRFHHGEKEVILTMAAGKKAPAAKPAPKPAAKKTGKK